jgi:hypothetical protein
VLGQISLGHFTQCRANPEPQVRRGLDDSGVMSHQAFEYLFIRQASTARAASTQVFLD